MATQIIDAFQTVVIGVIAVYLVYSTRVLRSELRNSQSNHAALRALIAEQADFKRRIEELEEDVFELVAHGEGGPPDPPK